MPRVPWRHMQMQFSYLLTCRSTPQGWRHKLGFTPDDLELRVHQPFITYTFVVTIYFYGRSCVVTRPPFTFSHIFSVKNKERRLVCFLFEYICKINMSHETWLMIGLFLSHNLWLSNSFRAGDHRTDDHENRLTARSGLVRSVEYQLALLT